MKPEQTIKRIPAQPGDLLQYLFTFRSLGMMTSSLTTRRVIKVVDNGAAFVVEGGYHVTARQVTTFIPCTASPEPDMDEE
ncbi:MAG: hypothetical protein ACR2G5_12270 [Pyrinomonadaceae bacterium]